MPHIENDNEKPTLTLAEYQETAVSYDTFPRTFRGDAGILSGLAAEAGEINGVNQKKVRDNIAYETTLDMYKAELGDLLWYLAVYADRIGFTLDEIACYNIEKCEYRKTNNKVSGNGDFR